MFKGINIYLTDSLSGEERLVYTLDKLNDLFNWEKGHCSCDCNRIMFFKRKGNEDITEALGYPCNVGENRFILRIEYI